MKKLLLIALTAFAGNTYVNAQAVTKKVVVEQFTNTYCSVCASRNPGFYGNLAQFPQVLHISYFPSAPYAACPLNQHNKTENDDRTNHYGIYGSTPRIVIQGNVIASSANYSDNTLFQSQLGQTTPFELKTTMALSSPHTISVRTVVRKVDASPLTSLQLYAALVEDTLVFNANNGETHHYDVFRKALWPAAGMTLTAPANIGDSLVYTETIAVNSEWNLAHMFTMTMLQNANKEIVQAAKSNPLAETLSINDVKMPDALTLYPNPAIDRVKLTLPANTTSAQVRILDATGRVVSQQEFSSGDVQVDVLGYKRGLYYMYIVAGEHCYIRKFVKY